MIACFLLMSLATSLFAEEKFRLGIIGTTSSHAPAFVELLHAPDAVAPIAGYRVVGAYPGGMPDNPRSWGRLEGFAKGLEQQGIKLHSTIEDLLPEVDGILLLSVDGRPRLEQAKPVIAAGKPLFIDKPMAASLPDVLEIFRLAEEKKVPLFSTSSLRYVPEFQKMRTELPLGKIIGASAWSPGIINERHPDLFWYGIHGVESLFTFLGPGCQTVQRTQTDGTEFVVGVWSEGRIGTFRGIRTGKHDYGAFVFAEKGNADAGKFDGYKPLVEEIGKFFRTNKPPVDTMETIEIFAFMEAADVSKQLNGQPVSIAETIEKAKKAVLIPANLQVSADGTLQMNGNKIDLSALPEALDLLTVGKPNSHVRVILRAEKGTPHEIVLSVCNNLGKAVLANYLYER